MQFRKVLCKRTGTDRYGRFLGACWAQPILWGAPVDLSAAMVASGHAEVYRQESLSLFHSSSMHANHFECPGQEFMLRALSCSAHSESLEVPMEVPIWHSDPFFKPKWHPGCAGNAYKPWKRWKACKDSQKAYPFPTMPQRSPLCSLQITDVQPVRPL